MLKLRNKLFSSLLVAAATLTLFADLADARSLSGGKSFGRPSNNYSQRQAPAPSPTQQRPAPAQQPAAAPAQPAPAPQVQPQRNRWLGPLAGVAAGLGIAALMSHFGMGGALAESMSSMLVLAAIAMAGLFLWRRFRGGSALPSNATAQPRAVFDNTAWQPAPSLAEVPAASAPLADAQFNPTWTIPADFDVAKFLHSAKVFYVRLQAAWDTVNLDDIREFTTPGMFAEIKLQLNERGTESNFTDVVSVNAELLGIEQLSNDQLASVRFTGVQRLAENAPAEAFDEVWNLTRSPINPVGWLLAGIQQAH